MQLLTYKTILVITKPQAQQWSFNYYLLINIAIACMLLKKIIKTFKGDFRSCLPHGKVRKFDINSCIDITIRV